jgi:hypothetical protein
LKRRTSRGELIQRRKSVKPELVAHDAQEEPVLELEKA